MNIKHYELLHNIIEAGGKHEYVNDSDLERYTLRDKDGSLHSLNGPALVYVNHFSVQWNKNQMLHNVKGPAIIFPDGEKRWYLNDQLHRDDGPAVIWPNGSLEWWIKGKLIKKEYTDE